MSKNQYTIVSIWIIILLQNVKDISLFSHMDCSINYLTENGESM